MTRLIEVTALVKRVDDLEADRRELWKAILTLSICLASFIVVFLVYLLFVPK